MIRQCRLKLVVIIRWHVTCAADRCVTPIVLAPRLGLACRYEITFLGAPGPVTKCLHLLPLQLSNNTGAVDTSATRK